ncbi:hypothetical protein E4U16_000901 [Claviceps sp. LM84 group G4]|nr:hypothetical protein E4U16_000901 [Claviceps sp. LM84 group G4]
MSSEAGPSKRRRLLSTTEVEDTAPEESTRRCSKCLHNLPMSHFTSVQRPTMLTKNCQRCRDRDRRVPGQRQVRGSSPENIRGPSEYNPLQIETPSQQESRRIRDRDDRASRALRRNGGETVPIAPRPVSFVRNECGIRRPFVGARSMRDGICFYCTSSSPARSGQQVKWCSRGEHATTRDKFLYREFEYESCLEHEEHLPPSTSLPEPEHEEQPPPSTSLPEPETHHDISPDSGLPPA